MGKRGRIPRPCLTSMQISNNVRHAKDWFVNYTAKRNRTGFCRVLCQDTALHFSRKDRENNEESGQNSQCSKTCPHLHVLHPIRLIITILRWPSHSVVIMSLVWRNSHIQQNVLSFFTCFALYRKANCTYKLAPKYINDSFMCAISISIKYDYVIFDIHYYKVKVALFLIINIL